MVPQLVVTTFLNTTTWLSVSHTVTCMVTISGDIGVQPRVVTYTCTVVEVNTNDSVVLTPTKMSETFSRQLRTAL